MSELAKTTTQLLHILSDGKFHSGEVLGGALGVSRAAVWKCVNGLSELGIPIDSVRGRGYQIPGGLDLLSLDAINSKLCERLGSAPKVEIFPLIESTNAYLLAQPYSAERICLAEFQSGGRGRRGRRWESPFGQNIYASLATSGTEGVARFEGLSLAVAVMIIEMLESFGISGITLKWPNDLLYHDNKLAGILVEMRGDPIGEMQLVTGVGVNYSMAASSQPALQIDQPWIDLRTITNQQGIALPDRNELAAALIAGLVELHRSYQAEGFGFYRARWLRYAAHIDQNVCVMQSNSTVEGIMMGISETGGILIQADGAITEYHSGDVSVRPSS